MRHFYFTANPPCLCRFPPAQFGKLYGTVMALSAVVSLLQFPCFSLINGPLHGDPFAVSHTFTVFSLYALTLHMQHIQTLGVAGSVHVKPSWNEWNTAQNNNFILIWTEKSTFDPSTQKHPKKHLDFCRLSNMYILMSSGDGMLTHLPVHPQVNVALTLLSCLAFIHPLNVFLHCRRQAARRAKADKTISS